MKYYLLVVLVSNSSRIIINVPTIPSTVLVSDDTTCLKEKDSILNRLSNITSLKSTDNIIKVKKGNIVIFGVIR
jgi:hypothetical protein